MIFNLVAGNTREGEVMNRLLEKLEDMRKALRSDRVYDVIGEIIPAPKLDALMKDWLGRRRTMAEILAELDLRTDQAQVDRIRADMDNKALGDRYIDMRRLEGDRQRSKEHRLMPEYIERFFVTAYRSFGGTVVSAKARPGVWSIARVPPDLRKLPEALERRFGRIGETYPEITFDKDRIVGYSDMDFVGPGHPLFEGVVERVLRDYGDSLRRGACFYNADATEPTVLWLVKCGVEDGRGHRMRFASAGTCVAWKPLHAARRRSWVGSVPVSSIASSDSNDAMCLRLNRSTVPYVSTRYLRQPVR